MLLVPREHFGVLVRGGVGVGVDPSGAPLPHGHRGHCGGHSARGPQGQPLHYMVTPFITIYMGLWEHMLTLCLFTNYRDNVVQINEGMRTALVAGAPFLVLSFLGVFLLRRLMGWLYGVAMIAELEGLIKRMGKGYASLMAIAVAGIIAQRVITEVIISP